MWLHNARGAVTHSEEPEHSYLGSATDLMVGLLFIFIIMVAFLSLQNKSAEEAVQQSDAPIETVTNRIGAELAKSLHGVTWNPGTGVITLPEGALFDSGSSVIKESAAKDLNDTVHGLSVILKCYVSNQRDLQACDENPEGHAIDTIFIEGHTDDRPMNRAGGNIKLSLDRALSVNAAFVTNSPLAQFRNKLNQPIISYSAYADTRPLIESDPSNEKNRRVDLRIVLAYKPPSLNNVINKPSAAVEGPAGRP
jgi:chemotaxis protein MotB